MQNLTRQAVSWLKWTTPNALLSAMIGVLGFAATPMAANASPTYQVGRINNVTFAGDGVLIRLDTGLPDNCAGTGSGWMLIPISAKPIQAFVLGLWLRGDAAQVTVVVYTTAGVVSGYCQIDQIDPEG
jgi:hypothetical protein